MLKETSTEKGCFRGCFVAIAIGAVLGAVAAWIFGGSSGPDPSAVGAVGNGMQALRVAIAVVGALGGALLGGLVGLVFERLTAKKEKEINEF